MDIKNNKVTKIIGRTSAINISNIGGTEEIARFLINLESADVVQEESIDAKKLIQLVRSNGNKLILLGASKLFIIKILIISSIFSNIAHIEYIKTSNKTNSKDLFIRFILLHFFKKINVTDLDGNYFSTFEESRRNTIDISALINSNLINSQHDNVNNNLEDRKFDIGYIGRIDREKGFFNALDILSNKKLNNFAKSMDLLLWDTPEELEIISKLKKEQNILGIKFKFTEKTSNSLPNYQNMKAVLLPYKNFDSTIRIPLVIFEALKAGCLVFLPEWIKRDEEIISIINEFNKINKIFNNIFFYKSDANDCINIIKAELDKLS